MISKEAFSSAVKGGQQTAEAKADAKLEAIEETDRTAPELAEADRKAVIRKSTSIQELIRKNRRPQATGNNRMSLLVRGLTSDVENEMRDALIKSFMVVFTHESSHHLLLNKDLIDIAFYCLEFCFDISHEAKRKLSKLISIIFKFPQVQDKLLTQEVIVGVNHLLEQVDNYYILQHTLRAITYMSMSYVFVSSGLALDILDNLIPLLASFENDDLRSLLFSICNILKGSKENALFFVKK